jgi:hypothetical protein
LEIVITRSLTGDANEKNYRSTNNSRSQHKSG